MWLIWIHCTKLDLNQETRFTIHLCEHFFEVFNQLTQDTHTFRCIKKYVIGSHNKLCFELNPKIMYFTPKMSFCLWEHFFGYTVSWQGYTILRCIETVKQVLLWIRPDSTCIKYQGCLSVCGNAFWVWERFLCVATLSVCGNAFCMWERFLCVATLSVCGNAFLGVLGESVRQGMSMDKLQLTGRNLGQVFNYRSDWMFICAYSVMKHNSLTYVENSVQTTFKLSPISFVAPRIVSKSCEWRKALSLATLSMIIRSIKDLYVTLGIIDIQDNNTTIMLSVIIPSSEFYLFLC